MRKTDDAVILQMLRDGKKQTTIARFFGVSDVAIHKRVKRLTAKPASLEKLTGKEQEFVLALADGKSRTQAVMESFDVSSRKSAKALQSTLMQKDDVRLAYSELMQIYGITRGYRVKKLAGHIDHPDPVISLKALDTSFKIDHAYDDPKDTGPQEINIQINIVGADPNAATPTYPTVIIEHKPEDINHSDN